MKVGIIGLGFMGAVHVAALEAYPEAELAAVVSRDPKTCKGDFSAIGGNQKVEKRHFDFSQVTKYSTWQEIVADDKVEAISICLPTDFHADVTVAALNAGKHVICEKPMALTMAECEDMITAAERAKRILMIGHVLRFWPEYMALRHFVSNAEYGKVRQATFLRKAGLPDWSKWLPDETKSGGAVMDLLVHDIDQILLLFGMPERVTAKPLGSVDALMASFIYPGSPEVRLHGGWFEPGVPFDMSFQVRSDKGEMALTSDGLQLSDMSGVRNKVELPPGNAYEAQMHYFLDCCRSGEEPKLCRPQDSASAVKVALALKESRAKDGEQVKC